MRHFSVPFFIVVVVFCLVPLSAVDAQIEFIGELEAIDTSSDPAVLTLRLTPAFSIPVLASELTEVRDESGNSITLEDLMVGQNLEVEGIFTPDGILALEISVAGDVTEFEIRGVIEAVTDQRQIQVHGLLIEVPETAEIKDQFGNILNFDELQVGQQVKVEGMTVDGALVAREVTVRTARDAFAAVRFRGVISEVLSPDVFIVTLEGEVPVQVVITPQTEIRGDLAVGVVVRVIGRLRPDLAVEARRVVVERLLQLAPPRVRLQPNQQRRVVVILRSVFDEDVELSLASRDPDVATPEPLDLVVPAGRLTSAFLVIAGNAPGETVIDVAMPAALGGLSVELPVAVAVRDDETDDEQELEIEWQPDRLSASPPGSRLVRLQLNQPAPDDLIVSLALSEGDGGQVEFPAEAMIPAGARAALVEIGVLSASANVRIRAMLPEEFGGDSDDLEIVPPRTGDRIGLAWRPDEVETEVGEEFTVRLALDQAAPEDLTVFIRPHGGRQTGVLEGVPSEIQFEAGEREVELTLVAVGAGRVRFRASLPLRVGGRHADLEVEIER